MFDLVTIRVSDRSVSEPFYEALLGATHLFLGIALAVLAFLMMGDVLRDVLDSTSRAGRS